MQVNSIELKLGVRLNVGDYQGVNAEITLKADLDPREGEGSAFDTLRRSAVEMLAAACQSAHPNRIRAEIAGDAPQAQLAAPATGNGAATAAETAKRTRRTKEQIAADEAAKARVNAAATQLGEVASDELLEGSEPEDDNLLGDEIPDHPPMTPAECKTVAGQVLKKLGGPSLAKLLTSFGAKDFPSLDAKQYANFAAKAKELIGTA
jgi:hypothetical protein